MQERDGTFPPSSASAAARQHGLTPADPGVQQKNTPAALAAGVFFSVLALPIFPGRLQPSIVSRSELNFRVRDGNGWTLALISTNFFLYPENRTTKEDGRRLRLPANCRSSPRAISTGQLHTLLYFHLRPINQIIFLGPYSIKDERSHLRESFTLRCFQRLSRPYIATQLCPWQDNWCTRGTSIPVLSY